MTYVLKVDDLDSVKFFGPYADEDEAFNAAYDKTQLVRRADEKITCDGVDTFKVGQTTIVIIQLESKESLL